MTRLDITDAEAARLTDDSRDAMLLALQLELAEESAAYLVAILCDAIDLTEVN